MKNRSLIIISAGLILLSIGIYSAHYSIFHDAHHILIYLVGDIAFVPIEVLLVTLILHRLLESHERSIRLEKLNMVIGVFYNRVGTGLLSILTKSDEKIVNLRNELIIRDTWTDSNFESLRKNIEKYSFHIDTSKDLIHNINKSLTENQNFLIQLLENPVILEHDSFTELLQSVFHTMDELEHRKNFENLPPADYLHLKGDFQRMYKQLVISWISYMQYLKKQYPYLFSLAVRTNPFDEAASAIISK